MAGKTNELISTILERTTPSQQIHLDIQNSKLMYSVFGFVPATDFTDNAVLLSNLGYILAQQDHNVCLVDFKVFSPNLYMYLGVNQNKRGSGLLKMLKDDNADVRDEVVPTKHERLYLLSSSPQDLIEEYFDFGIEKVALVIDTLKKCFDIVLIDIPNNPPLEFCLEAMKQSHIGFFTVSERVDALSNITRLLDFASSVGISVGKFTNVIFVNLQGIKYDFSIIKKLKLNIVAELPLIKGALADALDGKLYVKDNPIVNSVYKKEMFKIVEQIIV